MRDQEDMFVRVQRETDPVRQARLAGELISLHQQRLTELARLRKAAINRAAQQTGMNFTEIAAELRLTRGRISQIRKSAPPAERGFFGVGRLTVAVPLRLLPGRSLPVISSEDSLAAEALIEALTDYSFHVQRFHIPPDGEWDPSEETIATELRKVSTRTPPRPTGQLPDR